MTTLYFKLKAQTQANPDLLVVNKRDLLVHDRRDIRRMVAGQQWLWMLGRYGTTLFPVACGQSEVYVSSWLSEEPNAKVFLIRVTADGWEGEVTEISRERAFALAREPAPKDMVVWRPSLFRTTILRNGVEIGKIETINGTVLAKLGNDLLGRFRSWREATKAVEKRLGPSSPMVCV